MGDIVDIYEKKPHVVSEVICLRCFHRWIAVRPEFTLLVLMECPKCGKVGYVIETGQEYEDKE